jgi:hypothetical protein
MRMHRDASYAIPERTCADELLAARDARGTRRSSSASSTATATRRRRCSRRPGTISFLMDCDTTGVEPDFSLVKFKELVGGGQMTIVNRPCRWRCRRSAMASSRSSRSRPPQRARHDRRRARPEGGAPAGVRRRRRRARDLAHGPHQDDGRVQPFISRRDLEDRQPAQEATVEDIADAYTQAWQLGVKALAIYRDGSKTAQALRTDAQQGARQEPADVDAIVEQAVKQGAREARRGASGCRASASRSRTSSRSAATRATSPPACTRTARRRDLPDRHRQGGLDAARHDELVRDGDLDRAAVRRAARDARAQVQLHALRARGHHRQPGDPVREVDARLHHALAGLALPRRRRPGGARHPHARGARPQGRPGGRAVGHLRHRRPSAAENGEPISGHTSGTAATAASAPDRLADRHAAGRPRAAAGPRPRPGVPASAAA